MRHYPKYPRQLYRVRPQAPPRLSRRPFFFINKIGCNIRKRSVIAALLSKKQLGERFKSALPLRPMRVYGGVPLYGRYISSSSVSVEAASSAAVIAGVSFPLPSISALISPLSLLKAAQIDKANIQPSQDGIIERTGDLFTVTGDKRDGIAVVDERDGFLCLSLTDAELVG